MHTCNQFVYVCGSSIARIFCCILFTNARKKCISELILLGQLLSVCTSLTACMQTNCHHTQTALILTLVRPIYFCQCAFANEHLPHKYQIDRVRKKNELEEEDTKRKNRKTNNKPKHVRSNTFRCHKESTYVFWAVLLSIFVLLSLFLLLLPSNSKYASFAPILCTVKKKSNIWRAFEFNIHLQHISVLPKE